MRIPLVRPNMPKLSEVQEYYQLAEKHGQYSNFGLVNDIAVSKLQKVYPGSYPVLVNNGTTAIQVALQATLPRGSRVALPTFTFIATLNAVVAAGMVPVLFDVDPKTWQIDILLLAQEAAAKRIDGAVVVSPFGYAVDIDMYDGFSSFYKLPIVYDFAPAWGHPISNENPTTFSFHATKTLPIGEGGVVFFQGGAGAYNGKMLINFDFHQGEPRTMYGMNGKMDELHCATLCTQLDRNEELLKGCSLNQYVISKLRSEAYFGIPSNRELKDYLQLPVMQITKTDIIEKLAKRGIASKRYYKPFLHDAFPELPFIKNEKEYNVPYGTLGLPRPSNQEEANTIVANVLDIWSSK